MIQAGSQGTSGPRYLLLKATALYLPVRDDSVSLVIATPPDFIGRLTELVNERMLTRRPNTELGKERVGVILQRCLIGIIERWLARARQSTELNCLLLSDDERTGHLPKLVEDLACLIHEGWDFGWREYWSEEIARSEE